MAFFLFIVSHMTFSRLLRGLGVGRENKSCFFFLSCVSAQIINVTNCRVFFFFVVKLILWPHSQAQEMQKY